MNLIAEWKWFLRKAWSVRLAVTAGLFSGASAILPLFVDAFPRGVFASLSMFFAVGAAVATVVDQPKMDRRCRTAHDRRGVARKAFDAEREKYD